MGKTSMLFPIQQSIITWPSVGDASLKLPLRTEFVLGYGHGASQQSGPINVGKDTVAASK